MKRNRALNALVEMSRHLTFAEQPLLTSVEDDLAKEYVVNCIKELDKTVERYLLLSSLPFVIGAQLPNVRLEQLWPVGCTKCATVVRKWAMPTGNMQPTYFVIGDAPGVGIGPRYDEMFDRAWVNGPSSHLLRKALFALGIHHETWYSNLLICSTPENRPSVNTEVSNCNIYLQRELKLLNPKHLIVLGRHAEKMVNFEATFVTHPSAYIRSGKDYKAYANHISSRLGG